MENAKLEATLQQQGNKIEALQQDQQTSASVSWSQTSILLAPEPS